MLYLSVSVNKFLNCSVTSSRRQLVSSEWIEEGVHINAIGTDARGKQELDPRILKRAKIVVDAWEQASHSGEINLPLRNVELSKKDIYANIGVDQENIFHSIFPIDFSCKQSRGFI